MGTWPWALAGNGSMPGQSPPRSAAASSAANIPPPPPPPAPELYPGMPLWVENVEEFVEAVGGGVLPAHELDRQISRAMRRFLRRAASHTCARCSYKRHTQRSTHFSALLDACAPPPSPALAKPLPLCSPSACSPGKLWPRLRFRVAFVLLFSVLTACADTATAVVWTPSAATRSTSSCCAAAAFSSDPKKWKSFSWPRTLAAASC
jgi:hypothetical protein